MSRSSGIIVALAAICALCITLLILQREKYRAIGELHEQQFATAQDRIDAMQRQNSGGIIGEIIRMIQKDLDTSDSRTLTDETLEFIKQSSLFFEPIQIVFGDTTINASLSPERGQLLLYLVTADIDSNSLAAVFAGTRFHYADLRNVSIRGVNMQQAQLSGASFAGATLHNVNLSRSNLTYTDFNTATLKDVKLNWCNLVRANMKWLKADSCDFSNARISGAILSKADVSNSRFNATIAKRCNFDGAVLTGLEAVGVDLFVSNLSNANLTDAKLTNGVLSHANLCDAVLLRTDLSGTNLNTTAVNDAQWVERLEEYGVVGRDTIALMYNVTAYGGNAFPSAPYQLAKIAN